MSVITYMQDSIFVMTTFRNTHTHQEKLEVRLTTSEKALIQSLAQREGLSKSEYVRNLLKNQERVFTLPDSELENLKREFAKLTMIGSNINQVTYHLNVEAIKEGISKIKTDEIHDLKALNLAVLNQLADIKEQIINLINIKG
ncbi:MAG: hypothetical protein HOJ35_00300 [Bdellovibrionales bacterium]|nr:hypothetical protein [Bdellovibrionales bacterium]